MNRFFLYPLLILALFGCSKETSKLPEQPIVNIRTAVVEMKDVPDILQAIGTVEAKKEAVLSAKITGAITAFRVDEGSFVKKGDVLLTIDAADISAKRQEALQVKAEGQAALREADAEMDETKAALDNADINYERISNLYKEQAVTKKELDDMSAQHKMAEAKVEQVAARRKQVEAKIAQAEAGINQADTILGYSVIRSPINGVVSAKMANTGEMASPGRPLLKVMDGSDLRLVATVKESYAAAIKKGNTVKITVDALGPTEPSGKVAEILPAADPATHSLTVKIDLPKTDGLRPGMFGRAWIPVGTRRVVMLPQGSLVDKEGMQGVYVVGGDGILRFQAVRLGSWMEALAGLSGGEKVAVGELGKLKEGMRVKTN